MGNIPGLSGEAGGTEDVAGVTHGIDWEMFNSSDEDMEVLESLIQTWTKATQFPAAKSQWPGRT
jgi:hypothetical protein